VLWLYGRDQQLLLAAGGVPPLRAGDSLQEDFWGGTRWAASRRYAGLLSDGTWRALFDPLGGLPPGMPSAPITDAVQGLQQQDPRALMVSLTTTQATLNAWLRGEPALGTGPQ
jgi:hypothetical protein